MKKVCYKIVPNNVPAVNLTNKENDNFKSFKHKENNKVSRSIDTECLACEYISDGTTVIKLSELVKKLRERKEIKLTPLSLAYSENVTEYHPAGENEGYSSVSVHVCVESKNEKMKPHKLLCYSMYTNYTFTFKPKEDFDNDEEFEQFVLLQLYPESSNRNVIEIKLDISSKYDLEEECWYCLIPKCVFGITHKVSIYGYYNKKEYLMYELENNNLQQNQKITVLNYL